MAKPCVVRTAADAASLCGQGAQEGNDYGEQRYRSASGDYWTQGIARGMAAADFPADVSRDGRGSTCDYHPISYPAGTCAREVHAIECRRAGCFLRIHRCGGCMGHEQNRRTQDRSVWPTLETRTDEAPVVGSMDRLSRQQRNRANHLPAAWASDREPYDSWHDDSDVGGCLGRGIPVISHSGGVSVSRVCAVHADDWHRFLACSSGALSSLRVESPEQQRRNHIRCAVGRVVWTVVVFVSAANRNPMVRGGLSPRL